MPFHRFSPPAKNEYASYYQKYIELLPEGDVFDILEQQMRLTLDLLLGMTDEQADFAYARGKWTIREVVGHMIDTERIFATRALCFARGETAPMPGYDQDAYVRSADFSSRSRSGLSGEYEHLRKSNLFLFSTWDPAVQMRRGMADGNEMSVRAIPFMIAGHERHHLNVITRHYLPRLSGDAN